MPEDQERPSRENLNRTASARQPRWSTAAPTGWSIGEETPDGDHQHYHTVRQTHEPFSQSPSEEAASRPLSPQLPFGSEVRPGAPPCDNVQLLRVARSIASCSTSSSGLRLDHESLSPLWHARVEPPVTVESLSVLDLDRLTSYAKLHHDFHFEPEIILRADPKPTAKEYWAVLAIEFALYIQHNDCSANYSWLRCLTSNPQKAPPQRLQRLFTTIRDIMKTLVPHDYAADIESCIDPKVLASQVWKGCCNLVSIAEYIRSILKSSCSWEREQTLDTFVDQMRLAVQEKDPCRFASAVEHLFVALEQVKIDRCHSYIQRYRLRLLCQSVLCEQDYFLRHIDDNWDTSKTLEWYEDVICSRGDPIENISAVLLDFVSGVSITLPKTFEFDVDRLEIFQANFQFLCAETAIKNTVGHLIQRDGETKRLIQPETKEMLLAAATRRVEKVDPTLSFWHSNQSPSKRGSSFLAVTLEIARVASIICCKTDVPLADGISEAESMISRLMDVETSSPTLPNNTTVENSGLSQSWQTKPQRAYMRMTEHNKSVQTRLKALVSAEVANMRSMSATELCSEYVLGVSNVPAGDSPTPTHLQTGASGSVVRSQQSGATSQGRRGAAAVDGFQLLAQRIAHIAVIHWRVWEPILCIQGVVTIHSL